MIEFIAGVLVGLGLGGVVGAIGASRMDGRLFDRLIAVTEKIQRQNEMLVAELREKLL